KKSMSMGARLDYPVLNINLSYATLSNPDLMRYVFDCSVTTRYPLQNIIIEITETAEIRNINITREFIKNMKHYGLRFALDDFGTGFSSFSYLAKLGVDYIKLDKSLIRELLVNSSSHHIVRSLIELCKNLGIKTIAEGVENHEILLEASRYDFDFMQGYYFSRPRPISEFPDAAQGLAEVELQRLIQL
ncbi:MAG TPA: EAL domain-containing protein, partial [Thiolinea sp.]|nr:EAL domain-containing protein [Thiolinea sp.]